MKMFVLADHVESINGQTVRLKEGKSFLPEGDLDNPYYSEEDVRYALEVEIDIFSSDKATAVDIDAIRIWKIRKKMETINREIVPGWYPRSELVGPIREDQGGKYISLTRLPEIQPSQDQESPDMVYVRGQRVYLQE